MERMVMAEALFQTPEQRESGMATYRIYLDSAWRNVEGKASWKQLTQQELISELEQVYIKTKKVG